MGTVTRVIAIQLGGMLVVWLVAALIPGELSAGEVAHSSQETPATPPNVVLTVHEDLLSLRARNTSLKAIFEAFGQQLAIEVVARIPADERITLAFERLSLTEALHRLRPYANSLVVTDAKSPGTIRQLIVVSKRGAGVESRPTMQDGEVLASPTPSPSDAPTPTDTARPKPFTFEFDPAAVGERER